jgi:hypothetical protein
MPTSFSATPCSPTGEVRDSDANSPFFLIQQTAGETYMGDRKFVIHQGEADALVRVLAGLRD